MTPKERAQLITPRFSEMAFHPADIERLIEEAISEAVREFKYELEFAQRDRAEAIAESSRLYTEVKLLKQALVTSHRLLEPYINQ